MHASLQEFVLMFCVSMMTLLAMIHTHTHFVPRAASWLLLKGWAVAAAAADAAAVAALSFLLALLLIHYWNQAHTCQWL